MQGRQINRLSITNVTFAGYSAYNYIVTGQKENVRVLTVALHEATSKENNNPKAGDNELQVQFGLLSKTRKRLPKPFAITAVDFNLQTVSCHQS